MKIALVRDVKVPSRGTSRSAGLDFYIPNDFLLNNINKKLFLYPGESVNIPSGVVANIPEGYALIAFNKSGQAVKKALQVGACVCDEDYQGEIHLHVRNIGQRDICLEPGEKLVQFILIPILYEDVEIVDINNVFEEKTERGSGAFGSTGTK